MGQSKILQWSTILSTPSDRHNENVSEHTFSEPTLFAHKNCKIQIRQKPIPCQGPDVRQARLEHQTSEMIRDEASEGDFDYLPGTWPAWVNQLDQILLRMGINTQHNDFETFCMHMVCSP